MNWIFSITFTVLLLCLLVSTYGFTTGLNPLGPEFAKQLQSALSGTLDIQIGPGQIKSISNDGNTHSGPIQRRSLKSNEIDSYNAEIVHQPVHYIYPLTSQASNPNVQSEIFQGRRGQNLNAQTDIHQSGGNNNNIQSNIKQLRVPTYRTGSISNVQIDNHNLQTELGNVENSNNPIYSNIAFQDYLESQGFIAEEERPTRANTPVIHATAAANNIQPGIAHRRKNVVYGIPQWGNGAIANIDSHRRSNNNAQADISQNGGYNNNVQSGAQQEVFTGLGNYDIVGAIQIDGRPSTTIANAAMAEYLNSQVLLADEDRSNSNVQAAIVQQGGNNNNIQAGVTQNGRRAKPVVNIQTGKPLLSARRANSNVQSAVNQAGGNNNNVQSSISQNEVPVFYAHKPSLVPEMEITNSKPFLIKARQNIPQYNPPQSRRRALNLIEQSGVTQVGYNNRNIQGNLQQLGRRQNNNVQTAINQVGGNNNNVQSSISQTSGISAPATYDEILISNNGPVLAELELIPANELPSNFAIPISHNTQANTNLQGAINQSSRRQNTIPSTLNAVSRVGQAGRRQNNNAQVPVNQKGLMNKSVQSGVSQNGGSGQSVATINTRPITSPVNANNEINASAGGPNLYTNAQAQKQSVNNNVQAGINQVGSNNNNAQAGINQAGSNNNNAQAAINQVGSNNNNVQAGINQVGSNNNNVQSGIKQSSRSQKNIAQNGITQVGGNTNVAHGGIIQTRRANTKNMKVNQVGPSNINIDVGTTQVRRANTNVQSEVNQVGGNNNNVQSSVSQNSGISAPTYYDDIIFGEQSGNVGTGLDSGNNVIALAPRSKQNYNVQSNINQVGSLNSNYQGGIKQSRSNNNAQLGLIHYGSPNSNGPSGVKQSGRGQNSNVQTEINQFGSNNNNVQSEISQNDPTAPAQSEGNLQRLIDTTGNNLVTGVGINSAKIGSGNYVNAAVQGGGNQRHLIDTSGNNVGVNSGKIGSGNFVNAAGQGGVNQRHLIDTSGNNVVTGVGVNSGKLNSGNYVNAAVQSGVNQRHLVDTSGNNIVSAIGQNSGKMSSGNYVNAALADYLDSQVLLADEERAAARTNTNLQSAVKQSGLINNNAQTAIKQNVRRANTNARSGIKQEGITNNNVQSGISQGSQNYRPAVRTVIPLAGRRQNNNVQSGINQSGGGGRVVGVAEVDTTGSNADSGNQLISFLDINDSNDNEQISHVDIASQNGLYSNVVIGGGQHHYVGDGHVHIDGDFPNEGMYLTVSEDVPVNTAMTQMSSEILSNVLIGDSGRRAVITDGLSSDVIVNGGPAGEFSIYGLDCNHDLYSSTEIMVVEGSIDDPRFTNELTILSDTDNDMLANEPKHRHNNHHRRSGHNAPKCYCEGF